MHDGKSQPAPSCFYRQLPILDETIGISAVEGFWRSLPLRHGGATHELKSFSEKIIAAIGFWGDGGVDPRAQLRVFAPNASGRPPRVLPIQGSVSEAMCKPR